MKFLFFLLLVLPPGVAFAEGPWFGKQCPQSFQAIEERNDLAVRAASIRSQSLRPERLDPPRKMRVADKLYIATHLLGESSGEVFLARAPGGKTVVIKKYGGERYPVHVERAERMTRDVWAKANVLAGEPGGPPKVLAVDLGRGRVVTEYITGLQLNEISSYHLGLTSQQEEEIRLGLGAEMQRWHKRRAELNKAIHEQFMKQDPPPSEAMKEQGPLALDIEVRNFIYSFAQKRWIFFDP